MTERLVEVDGVVLCVESFGEPGDPAVLLVHGLGASMLWWDDDLCRALAAAGRFVIRYDHRDTGRSTTYEPGRPGYTGADLVADAARVLDAHEVTAAHVVGVSAGGGIAQHLALVHPQRVLSLVLVSTSPATPGDRGLPPPTEQFGAFASTAQVDWADPGSVTEHLVAWCRVLAGDARPFDEPAARALVERDVARARDVAAQQNHDVLPDGPEPPGTLASIRVPTLVLHGTADPLFPPVHGAALAAEIPGARLVLLEGAGHGIDPADSATVVAEVVAHTAR